MHFRLALCAVLVIGSSLLAIPVSGPAHFDSSGQVFDQSIFPANPRMSTTDASLIPDRIDRTEVLWQTAGTSTNLTTGVAEPSTSCIPVGRVCYGPGPRRCCRAPFPHHSFCSSRTGFGVCLMD